MNLRDKTIQISVVGGSNPDSETMTLAEEVGKHPLVSNSYFRNLSFHSSGILRRKQRSSHALYPTLFSLNLRGNFAIMSF